MSLPVKSRFATLILLSGAAALFIAALLLFTEIGGTSADQPVEPGDVFPVLERDATERDTVPEDAPDEARKAVHNFELKDLRRLGETDLSHYFIAKGHEDDICLLRVLNGEGDGLYFNVSCANSNHVKEHGLSVAGQARGGPVHVGIALPEGFDTVSGGDGAVFGEVHNQLFAAEIDGDRVPETLVATGEDGEITINVGGPEQ